MVNVTLDPLLSISSCVSIWLIIWTITTIIIVTHICLSSMFLIDKPLRVSHICSVCLAPGHGTCHPVWFALEFPVDLRDRTEALVDCSALPAADGFKRHSVLTYATPQC